MTGYVRQRDANIVNGSTGNASDVKAEFDQVQLAFNTTTGHKHDGSTGGGAPITATGLGQDYIFDPAFIKPKTTATYDLGSSSFKFKDGYFSGTVSVASFLPSNPSAARTNLGATAIGSTLFTAVDALAARTALAIAANYQVFTSSGTWTKPAAVNFVYVECVGAGGGGGNMPRSTSFDVNGGAGGAYFARLLDAAAVGATVTVTVGAGGVGGAPTPAGYTGLGTNMGGNGGTSSFGSLVSASGGRGGDSSDGASAVDGNIRGNNSGDGSTSGNEGQSTYDGGGGGGGGRGGAGGTSKRSGNGGSGSNSETVPGGNGLAPGGGGGACEGTSSSALAFYGAGGGAGGRGEVRVWSW